MRLFGRFGKACRRFRRDDRAVAAVEAGFLFPLLVTILCGSIDTGVALLINQKMITACQTVADILSREPDINNAELNDAVVAGRLSLIPYPAATFGVDVVGVQFIGVNAVATLQWRDTVNAVANDAAVANSDGLGMEDEGVLAVTTTYTHTPFFSGTFIGDLDMQEVSFARNREGLYITRTRS